MHLASMLARRLHDDRAAVAVSFILVFPIYLLIVGILVQYALLLAARVWVEHAAQVAARSAVTALPDLRPQAVEKAAVMALAPLSPVARGSNVDGEAADMADALQRCGVNLPDTFAQRYTYAKQATRVSCSGGDYVNTHGQEIRVTVRYHFLLTVPGASRILAPHYDTVAGVEGRYQTLVASTTVITSHGRKTRSHGDGVPW